MSIVAYTGGPGAGKSYAAVEHQIVPMLKAGRIVCTNIPLKFDLIRRDVPGCDVREFPVQTIATQPELMAEAVPPGAVLVLDEVWRLFPSGTKANQVPEQFRSFFAEHRHRVDPKGNSTQIVLVTQDLAQIGVFARQLVESTFRIVKLSTLGIPMSNRYRVDMFAGPVSGPNPNTSSAIRQVYGRYDKKVWQYYVSHTQSQVTEEGVAPNEAGADKRANFLMRPFFRIVLPIMTVALVAFIAWGCYYLVHKYKHPDKPAVAAGAHASGATVRPDSNPTATAAPSFLTRGDAKLHGASDWRIVGTLENLSHPERSLAVLSEGERGRRARVSFKHCVRGEEDSLRCEFQGFWYTEVGLTEVSAADEPLRIWTEPSMSHAAKADVIVLHEVPAAVAAPSPVEGSDELQKVSQNRLGLEDAHRPPRTLVGVAHGGS
jgi:zona occludens toxin